MKKKVQEANDTESSREGGRQGGSLWGGDPWAEM